MMRPLAAAVFPIRSLLMQARVGALFRVAGVLYSPATARALGVGRFAAAERMT